MKKIILFLLLILNSYSQIYSQESNEYVGAIKLNDSSIITYKIKFTEKNGELRGYSITDLKGEHETKSTIIGTYDNQDKLFSFKETEIIYTKSVVSENDFCFVNFSPVNFKLGKTKHFSGEFKGLFLDGEECINGEIYLNAIENINKRIVKVAKKIDKSKRISDSIKANIDPIKLMDSLNLNILKADKTISVFSKSKKINLIIYDGGQEDGDIVTVLVNNIIVLDNYEIDFSKKIIPINLIENKTSIVLKANNVGSISTNTAVIEINDNNNDIKALTNLKKGEKTQIDIILNSQ